MLRLRIANQKRDDPKQLSKIIETGKNRLLKKAPEFAKKAAVVYNALKWEWVDINNNHTTFSVPDESKIIDMLCRLVEGLDINDSESSCGGLFAKWENETDPEDDQHIICFSIGFGWQDFSYVTRKRKRIKCS